MHIEDLKNDICGKEIDCRNFIYAWIEFLEYLELWNYIFKVRIVHLGKYEKVLLDINEIRALITNMNIRAQKYLS